MQRSGWSRSLSLLLTWSFVPGTPQRHTSAQSVVCWQSRIAWDMLINMGWYVYVRSHVFTAILRSSVCVTRQSLYSLEHLELQGHKKIVLCHQCLSRWLNVLSLRMLILRHDNHISIQKTFLISGTFCLDLRSEILISLSHLYFVTLSLETVFKRNFNLKKKSWDARRWNAE